MNVRGFRTLVANSDAPQNVIRVGLGVFNRDIKVAQIAERLRVKQFIFGRVQTAIAIGGNEVFVWVRALWIFIEHALIAGGRRSVLMPVQLLHIFAVISL